ncbi:hypothetical protein L596_022921 [Steinernema carpocapsae]|uniref:Uncharacterized protein n=1 Tax=Steinernema carpocapsae TaxID=34508 RepID=A0A4U5MBZ8_STECR|nr:hypothetical protein L596_022921 [Steinernema carpocapsae]
MRINYHIVKVVSSARYVFTVLTIFIFDLRHVKSVFEFPDACSLSLRACVILKCFAFFGLQLNSSTIGNYDCNFD